MALKQDRPDDLAAQRLLKPLGHRMASALAFWSSADGFHGVSLNTKHLSPVRLYLMRGK